MIRDPVQGTANIAVMGVFWFLLLITLAFAAFALRELNRLRYRRPVQVRVLSRNVRLELREVRGRRGAYKAVFAIAGLQLRRNDTGETQPHTDEALVSSADLFSLAFLDRWEPGTEIDAALENGALELRPPPPWLPAAAFGLGALMFGLFAAMTKPFAYGAAESGIGWKIALLALFPIGAAAFGVGSNLIREKAEKSLQRVPVEAFSRTQPAGEFFAALPALGVTTGEGVPAFLNTTTISYCEFTWQGRQRRAVSLWCQPPEGQPCPGRLNPANPRDVKWGDEP